MQQVHTSSDKDGPPAKMQRVYLSLVVVSCQYALASLAPRRHRLEGLALRGLETDKYAELQRDLRSYESAFFERSFTKLETPRALVAVLF